MAGKGSRFIEAGYTTAKPFLPVGDKTMIEAVVDNVRPTTAHRFIFIVQSELISEEQEAILESIESPYIIQHLFNPTEGAASTVLFIKDLIDTEDPLLVVNSDQLVSNFDINEFLKSAATHDASILTLPATESKYSFAEAVLCRNGKAEIIRTAEKNPISDLGTVGIYYWNKGQDFVRSAESMIAADDRFNNEFYVCPTFNYIPRSKRIGYYNVQAEDAHFLGAPKEYEEYLQTLTK